MVRSTPLILALGLSTLALANCGETPTQPEALNPSAAAISAAFPSNSWTSRAPKPGVWTYWATAAVVDDAAGKSTVYSLGGRFTDEFREPPASDIYAYNVATNSWTRKTGRFQGAQTNGAGRVGDYIYISGGWNFETDSDDWRDISPRMYAYDWRRDLVAVRKADMPLATGQGVSGVINGKLYVLAGKCAGQELCRNFYRYNPATNSWSTLPPAPTSHRNGAGIVLGGKFYVAGGGASPYRSFHVYDPVTNKWSTPGLLPPRRQFAVGATAEGKLFVIGIEGGDQATNPDADRNTLAYSPPTNAWRNKAPYPGPHGENGEFLLRPQAAVRVLLDGRAHVLAVGSGIFKAGSQVRPGPSYLYTP
jgi:N-acetylneuraminic acid mutarotase